MERKILIVDDSRTVRASAEYVLTKAGYSVLLACTGVEALEILQSSDISGKIGMIISDINMPEMDGITLIREVRKLSFYKFVPILVLTTESQEDKKMEGKQAGASGWLVKPFTQEQLVARFIHEKTN